ncbi:flavin reductase [Mesorhizobium sp. CU2]|uniref:flavin reductase family protein n=1 Tax=unclassified Mesorhizobium TaxID=325217 RepID=UPI00112999FE|nr:MULTISPECIES: flavin reductase family protein [unclassified Mesorhizobium]TPN89386.1 flavin reductase [Mesorhizobium sp. CU3]TPO22251.1 flavin reductase [Mesorhizobium sp. CU2]
MTKNGATDSAAQVAEAFLTAFRHHPSGVAIITADPGDGPVALTISSLISVSVKPPTIAFSLSDISSSAQAIRQAATVVVHFVKRDDMQLARLCATSGADRFGPDVAWARLPTGEPHYPQVDLWFRAVIRGRLAVPGAGLVTAELIQSSTHAQRTDEHDALVYANRTWHGLRPIADSIRTPLILWPDDSATF